MAFIPDIKFNFSDAPVSFFRISEKKNAAGQFFHHHELRNAVEEA